MVALLVIRKDPQSMGLQPDGATDGPWDGADSSGVARPPEEYSWTRAQAIRVPAFWSLVLVHGMRMFALSTVQVFRVFLYIERGITPQLVAWAISLEAVVAIAISLMLGRIADRLPPRFLVAGALGFFLMMLLVTMNVSRPWHVFLATACYGATAASYVVGINILWPAYFGSRHIGSIRGLSRCCPLSSAPSALPCAA